MAIVIKMPKLSDTMEEGGIASWLKKEGEEVKEGEDLVEIETDKATMEYQSPEEGHLLQILIPAGKGANIGEPIAVLGVKDEKIDPAQFLQKEQASATAPATEEKEQAVPVAETVPQKQSRIKSSPLARKLAAERGIKLEDVQGSGPQGRILARDIQANGDYQESEARSGSSELENDERSELESESNKKEERSDERSEERVALSRMRKTIAKRLVEAKREIPHYYLKRSFNVEQVLGGRTELNKLRPPTEKISFNDIISYACIRALLAHPEINTAWDDGQEIIQYHHVNLAIAVALPNGLVTPVINASERMNLATFSVASKSVIAKAKAGKLSPAEYTGGTFTISNLGMYGIEEFSAIINPPQAAILAVGAPTSYQAKDGRRVTLTLSCDHRLIYGAVGAQFLATLTSYLETPLLLWQ